VLRGGRDKSRRTEGTKGTPSKSPSWEEGDLKQTQKIYFLKVLLFPREGFSQRDAFGKDKFVFLFSNGGSVKGRCPG
jgi:hypothetical protein